jgi:hypothetical protein
VAKQKERYGAWGEAMMNAWVEGDVEAAMEGWAEDCTTTAVDPFGNHRTSQGLEAVRQGLEHMATKWSNRKLIENKVLSANKKRGILHTWTSWTSGDGQEMACTFINILSLDKNDRCSKYTEWNVVKKKKDEAPPSGEQE